MKILPTSNNLIRSKLCTQMMFSQENKVKRGEDVEVLDRIPFLRSHTTNVEGETVSRYRPLSIHVCMFEYVRPASYCPSQH